MLKREIKEIDGRKVREVRSRGGSFCVCLVGYTTAGEWLNYSVNVAKAGTYNLSIRVASASPGNVSVLGSNFTSRPSNALISSGESFWSASRASVTAFCSPA